MFHLNINICNKLLLFTPSRCLRLLGDGKLICVFSVVASQNMCYSAPTQKKIKILKMMIEITPSKEAEFSLGNVNKPVEMVYISKEHCV